MLSGLTSPTAHAVGSVATSTAAAMATVSYFGATTLSFGLVLLGAGIPSIVAIFLANRAQKDAKATAMAFAEEAALRVAETRRATTEAASIAAQAVLTEAGQKAHEMLEAARLQAARVIATAVPVATAVVETAVVVAANPPPPLHP